MEVSLFVGFEKAVQGSSVSVFCQNCTVFRIEQTLLRKSKLGISVPRKMRLESPYPVTFDSNCISAMCIKVLLAPNCLDFQNSGADSIKIHYESTINHSSSSLTNGVYQSMIK